MTDLKEIREWRHSKKVWLNDLGAKYFDELLKKVDELEASTIHAKWVSAIDRIAELEAINDTYRIVDKKRFKRLTELEAKLDALREQLETKDLQLAACMTVAGANTRESAKKVRDMHPDYRCAAVEDVERAVDREMDYREQLDAVRGIAANARTHDNAEVRFFGFKLQQALGEGDAK